MRAISIYLWRWLFFYFLEIGILAIFNAVGKHIFVITGGSGFGKTEIIHQLAMEGYKTGGEYARELIDEQLKQDGNILPWKNIKLFQQEILNRRIDFYKSVKDRETAFVDRGIPDQLAFAKYRGFDSPQLLLNAASKYRYENEVFVAPPWKEIYKTDEVRMESFEEACQLHKMIEKVYRDLDYQLVEIPQGEISDRAKFIVNYIAQTMG